VQSFDLQFTLDKKYLFLVCFAVDVRSVWQITKIMRSCNNCQSVAMPSTKSALINGWSITQPAQSAEHHCSSQVKWFP
jgi:hypothetical protein